MGRLQDFQSVTPTASDNLLIVQTQGQGLANFGTVMGTKMDKANPTGTGSLSLNRKANTTVGTNSTTEGSNCTASGNYSHAEGASTTASGEASHSEGGTTTAIGVYSHAEGSGTTASGTYSHAEGYSTTASGTNGSHAEGYQTTASNMGAHSEGRETTASGTNGSHAEGQSTNAQGTGSHAEGYQSTSIGQYSHAEGVQTTTNGDNGAHAEGQSTICNGRSSHAEGLGTTATHLAQHVFGTYNVLDTSQATTTAKGTYVEIVGKGTSASNRSNARTLDWSGNETLAGTLTQSSDAKLKDVKDEAIPDVSAIKAVRFTWKEDANRDDSEHIGYIAQDVEKVLPFLVKEDAEGNKVLDYIAFLVAKVDSLEKQIEELRNKS